MPAVVVAVFTRETPERGEAADPENHGDNLNGENSVLMGGFGEGDGGDNEVGYDEECQDGGEQDEWNLSHLVWGVPVVHGGYGVSARWRGLLYEILNSPSAIMAMTISANTPWAARTGRRRVVANDMFVSVAFTVRCEFLRQSL